MTKKDQIHWICNWYYDQLDESNTGFATLDAHDTSLSYHFACDTQLELSWRTWKSRIRDAAKELGLTGVRIYNPQAPSGAPRYSFVYSN